MSIMLKALRVDAETEKKGFHVENPHKEMETDQEESKMANCVLH